MMWKNVLQKCLCYLFLKSLPLRTLWNSVLHSLLLQRKADFGVQGDRDVVCLIESQNRNSLDLEEVLEVTWTTVCTFKDAGQQRPQVRNKDFFKKIRLSKVSVFHVYVDAMSNSSICTHVLLLK